jgi:Thioredoxin-like
MAMRMVLALIAGFFAVAAAAAPSTVVAPPLTERVEIFPKTVPARCDKRPDKKQILFDLCRDQLEILAEAKKAAAASGKTVIIAYGADWCIWCHVFEAHILGGYGSFDYQTVDEPWSMDEKGKATKIAPEAAALNAFVSTHFVIVNISNEAGLSGQAVLRETAAEEKFNGGLPFVYAIDRNGRFGKAVNTSDAEIRRDGDDPYRGYDRAKLLKLLQAALAS